MTIGNRFEIQVDEIAVATQLYAAQPRLRSAARQERNGGVDAASVRLPDEGETYSRSPFANFGEHVAGESGVHGLRWPGAGMLDEQPPRVGVGRAREGLLCTLRQDRAGAFPPGRPGLELGRPARIGHCVRLT